MKKFYLHIFEDNKKIISSLKSKLEKLNWKKEKILNLYFDVWITSKKYKELVNEIENRPYKYLKRIEWYDEYR